MKTLPPAAAEPHVKVCGLRRAQDALLALEIGASFLGLIFAEGTPRCLSDDDAARLLDEVRAKATVPVRPFGVFVSEPVDRIARLVERLDLAAIQLHAPQPEDAIARLPVPTLRAVRVKGPESAADIERAMALGPVLLDTFVDGKHGGTGKVFDHSVAVPFFARGSVFIAGGLNPENIGAIAETLRETGSLPYAFDVSSGLEEAPGIKSHEKMRRFFRELRGL